MTPAAATSTAAKAILRLVGGDMVVFPVADARA
jgi:hypothetical protein